MCGKHRKYVDALLEKSLLTTLIPLQEAEQSTTLSFNVINGDDESKQAEVSALSSQPTHQTLSQQQVQPPGKVIFIPICDPISSISFFFFLFTMFLFIELILLILSLFN